MRWLIRMLAKSNKSKRGFTLIELMVVVIIVGILAAAAVPLYNFARSRAYASEGKAAIGTIRSAELVYKMENEDYLENTSVTGVDNLLDPLGVNVETNTWWTLANGVEFGVTDVAGDVPNITTLNGTLPWIYAKAPAVSAEPATDPPIAGITLCMSITTGEWTEDWP